MLQGAYIIEEGLVGHIERQDLGWKALDPAYKTWKERKKLSNQIWIATSTLLNSITVQVEKDGEEITVGANRKAPGKDGEDPVLVARVHEFGSTKRGIDERPLFRPTYREKFPEIYKIVHGKIEDYLEKLVAEGNKKV